MRMQLACLLLALLSARVLSLDGNINARYEKFRKQHINDTMSVKECDDVMRAKINNNNSCKKINTFIIANDTTVISICRDKGKRYGKMTKSLQRFDIVVCKKNKQQAKTAKCRYHGEKLNKKIIIIKCERGLPVHYDGDIGHCEN